MSDFLFARSQMAMSLAFHIVFAALGIGMPLLMAIMWLGTPVFRVLSPRKQKVERFPGAFEFRMMLSIALLFVIWSFVIAQSVFWFLAAAIPVSIGLVITGSVSARLHLGYSGYRGPRFGGPAHLLEDL